MERGLILVFAALAVCLTSGVQGTFHLSFSNNTEVNVTRSGCGSTRVCVEEPADCDPAGNSPCLFASVEASTPMAPNGTDLSIGLRGDTIGYIAFGLTTNSSEGTAILYLCGQNNSMFFFRTMELNSTIGILTPIERRVQEIRGVVNGTVIQCEFVIPNVNATSNTRNSMSTTFTILLGNGGISGSAISPFTTILDSGPLNLNLNIANTTTPAPNVTSAAITTPAPNATSAPITTLTPNATIVTNATTSSGTAQPHGELLLLSVVALFTTLTMLRA